MKQTVVKKIERREDIGKARKLLINVPHGCPDTKNYGAFVNTAVSAYAQLAWTEDAFVVRLTATEKDIRAKGRKVPAAPCEDSCLEFFFEPMGDGRYFNIEFNPNGLMFLGFGENVETLCRLVPEEPDLFKPCPEYTADGWRITYEVPFAFIKRFFPTFSAARGFSFRGNFYKCGDKTVIPHYYAWNPVTRKRLTFHAPECFGRMTLS